MHAADKFGVASPPPFLSLTSMAAAVDDDGILGGVNFASGGAGILNETGVYFVSLHFSICWSLLLRY